ncbi:MAG: hydrolase 1, exosortase A system-associated [Ignavibacteria bacterium]|nr:hydrolase 1, exosortase A system-associated [Ignavibacteria bacterium]
MNIKEQVVTFDCVGETLVGVACVPEQARSIGVIVVVGGPQYRVGSHRQFLLLSRTLASAGYPVLRFDYRGMGDSDGELRNFESVDDDIGAAIDAFVSQYPEVTRVVLWGLCDAASASLLYFDARRDGRVAGLCLLNPWVRSDTSLAKTHMKHYYGQRLFQRNFWKKFLTGKIEVVKAISGFISNWRITRKAVGAKARKTEKEVFQNRMARASRDFKGSVIFILSGNDYTAKEFDQYVADHSMWHEVFDKPSLNRVTVPKADHTFSSAAWRADVARCTLDWLMHVDGVDGEVRVAVAGRGE